MTPSVTLLMHDPTGALSVPDPPFITRLRNEAASRQQQLREQFDNWYDSSDYRMGYGGPGLYGGYRGFGFPADRSQDRSHAPLPYLTETEWRIQLAMARDLVQRNGLALGFRDHVRAFIGKMTTAFVLRGESPGATTSGPKDADGDGEPDVDPLVKSASEVWAEWRRLNHWGCGLVNRQRECVNRLIVEGECILRFFRGGSDTRGIPRVRHVEPEFLRTPPGGSSNGPEGWGPECDIDDAETVIRYWICDPDDPTRGQHVDTSRIVHLKNNVDGAIKRGLSDFFPVAGLLRKVLEIRENTAHVQRVLSAILWWEQNPTWTEAQVRGMIEAGKDYQELRRTLGSAGPNARTSDVNEYDPGSIIRTEAGRQVVPSPAAVNTPNMIQSDEMILRGVSFRWGLPDFMAGEGAASFAGLLVKGSPLVALTEERQDLVKEFEAEVARRVLQLAEESGRLPRGSAQRLEPVVTAPSVVIADDEKQSRTFLAEYEKNVADPIEYIKSKGLDPKKVAANIQAWKQKFPPTQPPGQPPGAPPNGQPPAGPNSTPPGSAGGDGSSPNNPDADGGGNIFGESKDSSGHEHKGKGAGGGQFTGGGGGENQSQPDYTKQLARLPETEDEAVALATAARDAIIGDGEDDCALDGDCERASWILHAAHPEIEIWHGEYNGEYGHNIVKAGDYFIDITSDQFDGGDPIRVWHVDEHERGVTGRYGEYVNFYRDKSGEKTAERMVKSGASIVGELPKYMHGGKLLGKPTAESKDASGHDHKGKGAGGGQFTGGSSGDSSGGSAEKPDDTPDEKSPREQWQDRADAREDRRQAATDARKHHDNDQKKPEPFGKTLSYNLTSLSDDEHAQILAADLTAYDEHHTTTRAHMVNAGASDSELSEYDRRVEKYRASLVRGQQKINRARAKWQQKNAKSDDVTAKRDELEQAEPEEPDETDEPEEPEYEDEPEEPPEPEYKGTGVEPDRDDYDEGEAGDAAYEREFSAWEAYSEWEDDHANWGSELEAVQARNKAAHKEWRDTVVAAAGAKAGWEKDHARWEKDKDKLDDKVSDAEDAAGEAEEAYDGVASDYETDHIESVDHIGVLVGEIEDDIHERLNKEDEADAEPEEEPDDEEEDDKEK